ncbi:conserved hypothetical protein [Psychromonas ingrahamii 37]|uniref:Zinc ribbon domain-containing protein n=1 Tax=Psychromonas ingrahamii (strain DSM 17664 / CCUG 51855 / 37) TaxID=357804 RepID=A1SX73_PSYIN|nr:hypothetical protein [Psychromonas ingrahamii]ABM04088.1 conserved hypothetical protein [Psychromonas ingrahamii 37]
MTTHYLVCPNCHYQRNEYDKPVHKDVCPACGIVYSKWSAQNSSASRMDNRDQEIEDKDTISVWESIKAQFLSVPYQVDRNTFYGRVLAFCVCFIWGWSFILGGIDWQSIGGSFLHNINLPFHEFGHLLFMPLGRFWSILGGSLFQILLPLLILLGFSLHQKDNFGASIMLWWCGQNFIDISPYIADAQVRALPLILNKGEQSHDWGNLLTMTGNLQHTQAIANISFSIGCLLIFVSYIWSAYLLIQQKKVLQQ